MWGDDWSSSSSDSSNEVDPEKKTTMMYQTGRMELGSKDEDGEESARYHVEFNEVFTDSPHVFVCPEGEVGAEYADVFGVTVIEDSITPEGFDVNVGRMAKGDNDGWGQNLQLNWLAILGNSTLCQTKICDVGSKDDDEESINVKCKFDEPFPRGSRPIIFATCYGQDYPDTFSVCIQKSGRKSCKLNICRGIGGGWGQDLRVCVLATTLFPCTKVDIGPGEGDRDIAFPELAFPGSFSTRPTIFTIAQHQHGSGYPDAFSCSPANVTNSDFQLNLQRGHPEENSWGQELRCQAIFLP